jgi:hypothetical protein
MKTATTSEKRNELKNKLAALYNEVDRLFQDYFDADIERMFMTRHPECKKDKVLVKNYIKNFKSTIECLAD